MYFKLFLLLFFCCCNLLTSQNTIDSSLELSKKELLFNYKQSKNIETKEYYLNTYLNRAKESNEISDIIYAYKQYTELFKNDEKFIAYSDSVIKYSMIRPDTIYPTNSYLKKGNYYFKKRILKKSLDSYLTANKFAKKYFKKEFIFISNHMIGVLKDRTGLSREALEIHKSNLNFAENKFPKSTKIIFTTHALHAIAFTYKNLGKLDSAKYFNDKGKKQALKSNDVESLNHLLLNEGVINYHNSNLEDAENNILKSLQYFEKVNDNPNKAEGYFYLGKINYDKDNLKSAIEYFKRMDTIFLNTNDLLPETRFGYKLLIDFYEKSGNYEEELRYLKRLISLDSVLNSNSKYLRGQIKNEYDIPNLLKKKEKLIKKLDSEKNETKIYFIVIVLFLSLLITGLYLRHRRLKQKVYLILDPKDVINLDHKKTNAKREIDIPKSIAEDILEKLKKIEKEEIFRDSSITLSSLAKDLKTNSTYLSKTINYYHNKNFSQFVNELRIKYAVDRLRTDSKFKKYTIFEIAKQSGFKSAETFSKLFKAKYNGYFGVTVPPISVKWCHLERSCNYS